MTEAVSKNYRRFVVNRKDAFSFLPPLCLPLLFFRFYFEDQQLYTIITILYILIGVFLFFAQSVNHANNNILLFTLVFITLGVSVVPFEKNDNIEVLPQFLANLGFAWSLVNSKLSRSALSFLLLFLISFFVFLIISGENPENVFTISRNYISVLMILYIGLYIFACQQDKVSPSLILISLSMIVFLWAVGRAGIISGAIILISVMIYSKKNMLKSLIFIVIFSSSILTYRPDILNDIKLITVGLERFERLSTGGQRNYINREYFEIVSTSVSNVIFGAPLSHVESVQEVGGNPHNAFINLHIVFGLLGFVIFWVVCLLSTVKLLKREQYLIVVMLFIGLFRSIFDSTAFYGPMDIIIFYCIFRALSSTNFLSIQNGHG